MEKRVQPHFSFLDGIRFVCALWVVISHFGAPPLNLLANYFISAELSSKLQVVFNAMFNGTAAVIIFFVISGFCIHLSYVNGRRLEVKIFYLSRLARIVVPMVCAIGLAFFIPNGYKEIKGILWTLYCEIIYYALYPLLLRLFRHIGIGKCASAAFLVAILLSFFPDDHKGYFWAYGIVGSAILGLPIWIFGCMVAEKLQKESIIKFFAQQSTCNLMRLSMPLLCILTTNFHYNTALKFKISMLFFAPIGALWIYSEFLQKKPFFLFDKLAFLGAGSYSVYLVHMLAVALLSNNLLPEAKPDNWLYLMTVAGAISVTFFYIVERPAHMLSNALRKNMKQSILSHPTV